MHLASHVFQTPGKTALIDTQAFRAVHSNHTATDWAIDVQRMTGVCRPAGQE